MPDSNSFLNFLSSLNPVASVANGVIGGFADVLSTNSRNRTEKQLARENQLWQSNENQLSRDWQERMWNAQNQYNSPSAMMQRLRDAGLNPFLASSENMIGQSSASSAGSPSMASAPSMPNLQTVPYGEPFFNAIDMALRSSAVDANNSNQQSQSVKNLVDAAMDAYDRGGMKAFYGVINNFAPFLLGSNPDTSQVSRQVKSQIYNIDMDSLNKEFLYNISNKWSDKEKQAAFDNIVASTSNIFQDIALKVSEGEEIRERIKTYASQIAKNFADAFNARKQGEYYEVSASQLKIINKMLDLQYQDAEADFAFGTGVRKWKKDITHRSQGLGLFLGQLGSQNVSNEIQSNKFLQYGKQVTSMVGDLFRVNVGASHSTTHFFNETPGRGALIPIQGFGR